MLEALGLNRGVYLAVFNEPMSKLLMLGIRIKNCQGGSEGLAEPPRDSLTEHFLLESMGLTIKLGCRALSSGSNSASVIGHSCDDAPPMIRSPLRPLFSPA